MEEEGEGVGWVEKVEALGWTRMETETERVGEVGEGEALHGLCESDEVRGEKPFLSPILMIWGRLPKVPRARAALARFRTGCGKPSQRPENRKQTSRNLLLYVLSNLFYDVLLELASTSSYAPFLFQ